MALVMVLLDGWRLFVRLALDCTRSMRMCLKGVSHRHRTSDALEEYPCGRLVMLLQRIEERHLGSCGMEAHHSSVEDHHPWQGPMHHNIPRVKFRAT